MKKVVILGAAGRDFHNFNVLFRNNRDYKVVAFTATQIPNIEGRLYPKELAGKYYPKGIQILSEEDLPEIIKKYKIDEVIFAYSDVSHNWVMNLASISSASGADFKILSATSTMLKSKKPVIAITAVRTGAGKSQTSRFISNLLRKMGKKVVVVRHPMPYGNLNEQVVQRFASIKDMEKHKCTIEEMEEYEPHITNGFVVYAGVDYGKILKKAEKEAEIILWDGGNNDLPFYEPDVHICIVDPHRPGHELLYHPGETNFIMANVLIINKVDTAKVEDVDYIKENIKKYNPKAKVIEANSPFTPSEPDVIAGKKVVVIEDGPTLTHGGMSYGAGYLAAKKYGASEIISPYPYAVDSILETYKKYPQCKEILPAMGYSKEQMADLEKTINRIPAELVIIGTPIDLRRIVKFNKPSVRIRYELEEVKKGQIARIIKEKIKI